MEQMSYVFLFTYFFTVAHFYVASKFHVVHPTKTVSFVFLSRSSSFSRWSSLVCRPNFSFFSLCLSLSPFSKFASISVYLNLILKKTRIKKHFRFSVLVFIDSLVVFASQDAGGHTLSFQNKLTIGIFLHEVGVRTVGVCTLRENQIFLLS